MKKVCFILVIIMAVSQLNVYSQSGSKTEGGNGKTGQNLLFNDLYAGYGAGSIFYFTGRMKHSSDYPTENPALPDGGYLSNKRYDIPESFGTIFLGYQRNLNRVVSWGVMFGFQNFTYTERATETAYLDNTPVVTNHTINNNDILLSGIARILFSYVNKPVIRIYSGLGLGFTVDFGRATMDGNEYANNKLWPGGQLTFMGIRYGRSFGGFFEFGFGSYGIINAGVSYKFAD